MTGKRFLASATTGSSAPSGSSTSPPRTRSRALARASSRSAPVSSVSRMRDTPSRLTERISLIPSRPSSTSSIGVVTSRSTSTGDAPPASVNTSMASREKSGNTSRGMLRNTRRPVTARAIMARFAPTGLPTAMRASQRINAPPPPVDRSPCFPRVAPPRLDRGAAATG